MWWATTTQHLQSWTVWQRSYPIFLFLASPCIPASINTCFTRGYWGAPGLSNMYYSFSWFVWASSVCHTDRWGLLTLAWVLGSQMYSWLCRWHHVMGCSGLLVKRTRLVWGRSVCSSFFTTHDEGRDTCLRCVNRLMHWCLRSHVTHWDCVMSQSVSAESQDREPVRAQSLGETDIWLGVVVLVLS